MISGRALESIVESLIVAAAAWPLWRVVAVPRFRRAFPRIALYAAALLAAAAIVVAALAWLAPAVLRALALLALVAAAGLWWRGREAYGRGRGLPPGSLALMPVAPWIDDRFYLDLHARHGPIAKASHFLRPTICVLGFDAAIPLLREFDGTRLRPPDAAFVRFVAGGFIRSMPPEAHKKYRRLVHEAVSRPVLMQAEPDVRAIIRGALDRFAAAGAGAPRGLALHEPFFELALAVMIRLFIGIGPDEPDFARLRAAYAPIDRGHRRKATLLRRRRDREVRGAVDEACALWRARAARFPASSTGVASCFYEGVCRAEPGASHDETLLANLVFIALVSAYDFQGLLQWMCKQLTAHPQWSGRLRAAAASDEAGAAELGDCIVRETLRMEQSEHLYREIVVPFEYRGFVFPRGWMLRVNVRESHRLAASFDHPDTFDPGRFLDGRVAADRYAPFGLLRRTCPGEPLTRAVGSWFALELAQGYDATVVDPGERAFVGWHWNPGPDFRVRLARRGAPACPASSEAGAAVA